MATRSEASFRVGDLELSIKFYEKRSSLILILMHGMKLLRKKDVPDYKVAIGTNDVYKSAEAVDLATKELVGGKILRQPGPLPGINTKIASFVDPDGWKVVLVDNTDTSSGNSSENRTGAPRY
ncbi:Putative glyoxalase family protein [Zea mays]|uniref:Putative glyoxalase family protein n=1 Tax=Zea mays TaxID=4577 RepID=A0A1D6PUK0_MAIZE|nr:Putative glyoxalase family protein [Zea mays]